MVGQSAPDDWTGEQIEGYLNGLALLSQLFWGPTPALADELVSGQAQTELAGPAELLGPLALKTSQDLWAGAPLHLGPAALFEALENEYVALFINSRGGIAAPLYQSCYESEEGLMMGPAAQRMIQRLQAEGLALPVEGSQPPDHLSAEMEYLFMLLERGFAQDSASSLAEAREFAQKELAPWLSRLVERLGQEINYRFYPAAARLARIWLEPWLG